MHTVPCVVPGLFASSLPVLMDSREELKPVVKAIEGQVDELATRLYDAGKIQDKAEGVGFYQR